MASKSFKVLDEFMAAWLDDAIAHYNSIKDEYVKFIATPEHNNIYTRAEWLQAHFGSKKLGTEAGIRIRGGYYGGDRTYQNYQEYMRRILEREAETKKAKLKAKIANDVGNITDVSLMIGINGDLNGYVAGDKGSVVVETIGAGGYNIQRYHYRVLIKKIKR